jgi:hypothetical protein
MPPSSLRPLIVGAILLIGCTSNPVTPEPEVPAIARWAGTYSGQSRFGAASGTWGNGGTYPLVITPGGEVLVSSVVLKAPTYVDGTATLSWLRADGNATNGEVTFRESLTSDFFFRDDPDSTVGQNMTGYIQRAGEGRLDYRGMLQ